MSRANSDPREAYVRVRLAVLLILPLVLLSWKPAFAGVAPRTEKSSSQDQYEDQLRAADVFLKRAQQLLDTERLQEALDAANEGFRQYQALPNTFPKVVYGKANALLLIGVVVARAGNYSRAIEVLRRASALYETLKNAESNHAQTLRNIAGSLQNLGRIDEAIDAYLSAADLFDQAGDYEQALKYQGIALSLLNELPRTAQSVLKRAVVGYNAARLHVNLAQYEEAALRFRDALILIERLSGPDVEALLERTLHGLAASLGKAGRLDEALTYFNRELDLYRGKADKELERARAHGNIAFLLDSQGHFADAIKNFRMSASIYQRHDNSGTLAAKRWANAGHLLHEMERYFESAEYFGKALALYQTQQGAERDRAGCHQRIAVALSAAGDWKRAHTHFRKEIEILRTLDNTKGDQALALGNTGLALKHLLRHNEAHEAYRQALSLYGQLPGTEAEQAKILNGTGNLLLEMKQDSMALKAYSAAVPLSQKLQGTPEYNLKEHTISLVNAGNLLAKTNRSAESISFYQQALSVSQGLKGKEDLRNEIQWNLGAQLVKHGQIAEGAAILSSSFANYWKLEGAGLLLMNAHDRNDFFIRHAGRTDYLYRLSFENPEVGGHLGFQAALSAKSMFSEVSQLENATWLSQLANANAAEIARLQELRRLVARRVLVQVSQYSEEFDPESKELKRLAEELERLEDSLREKVDGVWTSSHLPMPSVASLRAMLRHSDVVLEYVMYAPRRTSGPERENKDRYGVFVVRAEDESVIPIDLGPVAEIDQAILDYRQLFEAQTDPIRFQLDEDAFSAKALRLRHLLLDPIISSMPKPKRIYVVPTGLISLVPFEAMPEGRQGSGWRYLVEDHQIVYLSTSRDLTRHRRPRTFQSNEAWIVGNPDFDATPDERLGFRTGTSPQGVGKKFEDSIPNNWYLLEDVQELLRAVERRIRNSKLQPKVLTGVKASEEMLLDLRSPRFLLFATHGYFMSEIAPVSKMTWSSTEEGGWTSDVKVSMDPLMRSMLVLAGANHRYHRVSASYSGEKFASTAEVRQQGSVLGRGKEAEFELGDGLLTAYEVQNLDLRGTDLVVLVGCESGLGLPRQRIMQMDFSVSQGIGLRIEGGSLGSMVPGFPKIGDEAVGGLRQAFIIAGARSTISSLWTVSLRPTIQLMDNFLEAWLIGGRSRYDAFHAAQLNALQRARQNGSGHPFWWAGFVYVGEPDDLQNSR